MDYGLNATTVSSGGHVVKGNYMEMQAPAPLGGVSDAVGALDNLSGNLLTELDALEQRIAPVLRPPMPSTNGADGAARPTPSPLAGGIRELNARLYRALERVRDLSARVDL